MLNLKKHSIRLTVSRPFIYQNMRGVKNHVADKVNNAKCVTPQGKNTEDDGADRNDYQYKFFSPFNYDAHGKDWGDVSKDDKTPVFDDNVYTS